MKTLGEDEQYERQENLPARIDVTRTRACWGKDGLGVHLFVDVLFQGGVSRWRVYMPKRHANFADVLAGRGLVSIGDAGSGLEIVIDGEQD